MTPRRNMKTHVATLMNIQGYSAREISEHLGVHRSRVYQMLTTGEAAAGDMLDDPRWFFARARLATVRSHGQLAAVYAEYEDVWTLELTQYGRAVVAAQPEWAWQYLPPVKRQYHYEELVLAHKQGRLIHDWKV